MAKTIVITGGNSGIGLEAGKQLAAAGNRVVLLGRDQAKGDAAVAAIKANGGAVEFIAADLSTHAGVKAAAETVAGRYPKVDSLLLGAGVLTTKDLRTADGLHAVFAVNYLSRYHFAQRLLPQLRAAGSASVVLLVAGVSLDSKIDFTLFPQYQPFPGMGALSGIQLANYHYVQQLAKAEPTIRAAVVNVGLVATDIMRAMPAAMRVAFTVFGPLFTISVAKAAANPVWLCTNDGWKSGLYFHKPGKHDVSQALALDVATGAKVVSISRELTGA
jgi:NAD(P)-dependent dehydrogenase (short-subunit alcohol dehydrogenase family)